MCPKKCYLLQVLLIGKIHRQVNAKESSRIITIKKRLYNYNPYAQRSYKQITWLNQADFTSDHAWFRI